MTRSKIPPSPNEAPLPVDPNQGPDKSEVPHKTDPKEQPASEDVFERSGVAEDVDDDPFDEGNFPV